MIRESWCGDGPDTIDYRTSKVHEKPEPTTLSPGPRWHSDNCYTWDNHERNGTYSAFNNFFEDIQKIQDEQFVRQLKRCLENNTGGIRELINGQKS